MDKYKTFEKMSKEEQLALFVAWQEGKTIETLNDGRWNIKSPHKSVFFAATIKYRIAV